VTCLDDLIHEAGQQIHSFTQVLADVAGQM
jgi:hypothetical protein